MRVMRALRLLPPWLRRGLEAGIIAALVAIVTLFGATTAAAAGRIAFPPGLAGSLLVAPGVLALGVITVGYPIAYAATRPDAVFGALVAFLGSAALTAAVIRTQADLSGFEGRSMALGVLVGELALGPAIVGLGASQVLTRLGFGRRAGAFATVSSGVFALVILVLASRLG
jgi:hypothetical protein